MPDCVGQVRIASSFFWACGWDDAQGFRFVAVQPFAPVREGRFQYAVRRDRLAFLGGRRRVICKLDNYRPRYPVGSDGCCSDKPVAW